MVKKTTDRDDSISAINEYHKIEIQEIFARTRSSENIRTQVGVLCATANVTMLGFAFSAQKAGLVLAATMILFLWALADFIGRRNIGALYYRGLQLEKMYAPEKYALLHTYVEITSSRKQWVERLTGIAEMKNPKDRVKALRTFRFSVMGFVLPVIGVVAELLFGIYLLRLGWSLF